MASNREPEFTTRQPIQSLIDRTSFSVRRAAQRSGPVVKRAAKSSITRSKDFFSTLTLKKFRDAVDATMTDVVIVMSAQEAEISRLRQRVERLERDV